METIGDCYVGECNFDFPLRKYIAIVPDPSLESLIAVCGVPKANRQHAIVMSRFAREALNRFKEIICDLELTLGPDTGGKSKPINSETSANSEPLYGTHQIWD